MDFFELQLEHGFLNWLFYYLISVPESLVNISICGIHVKCQTFSVIVVDILHQKQLLIGEEV